MPTISVKKPFTVLVGIILVLVLGVVAFTKMTTDLLPNMDLPYMVVYATDPARRRSPSKEKSPNRWNLRSAARRDSKISHRHPMKMWELLCSSLNREPT